MITIPLKADCSIPIDISKTFETGDIAEFMLIQNSVILLNKKLIQNGEKYLLELSAEDTSGIPMGYYQYTIAITREGKITFRFDGKAFIREASSPRSVVRSGETIISSTSGQIVGAGIHVDTTVNWNSDPTLVGIAGHIYIYSDYSTANKDGNPITVPNVKIGDGKAFLIDNPFITEAVEDLINLHIEDIVKHVTSDDKNRWNNKVRCYIDDNDNENIVFTTL